MTVSVIRSDSSGETIKSIERLYFKVPFHARKSLRLSLTTLYNYHMRSGITLNIPF